MTLTFYLAITLLILIWLYPLIRRLQRLSVAARLIGEGDLSQRVDTNARSQLHGIESEFNAMVHRNWTRSSRIIFDESARTCYVWSSW